MDTEKIRSLLYSYGDWKTLGEKPRPYVFALEKEKQHVIYFGGTHSKSSHDKQFSVLDLFWKDFVAKDWNNPLVIIEGGLRPVQRTREEAIATDSESGYAAYLAQQSGIEAVGPEPDRQAERNELLKQFSKEEIQYYYFAQLLPEWYESKKRADVPLASFVEKHFESLKRGMDTSWLPFDLSLDAMKAIHKDLFGDEFDENNIDFIKKIINPTTEFSVINRVARASSTFRDVFIVSKIIDYWNQGKSLFVVFGLAHAVIQEPALRELLK